MPNNHPRKHNSLPSHEAQIPLSNVARMAFPAMTNGTPAEVLAMQWQLERSQWWPPQQLRQAQFMQLDELARHAYGDLPFYRERFDQAGIDPTTQRAADYWDKLPVLKRAEVQEAGRKLRAGPPNDHGPMSRLMTSGSSGRPISLYRTELGTFMWHAFQMRTQLLYQEDFKGKAASIVGSAHKFGKEGHVSPSRGYPMDATFQTGPTATLDIACDIARQKKWLIEQNPASLATHPSNLLSLLRLFEEDGDSLPDLKLVQTLSETVTPEMRELCQRVFGVTLMDVYSSEEVGQMAVQVPGHEHYMVYSENVMLEVLDDDDQPCKPGEIGRVIVTSLNNFATIMLRYQIEDYAQVGGPCPTGRGLPTLTRILGRRRNMLVLPDGTQHWPSFPAQNWATIAPIKQLQLVQHAPDQIEARLVVRKPLTQDQEEQFIAVMQDRLQFPHTVELSYHEELTGVGRRGKFEEFVSLVDRSNRDE